MSEISEVKIMHAFLDAIANSDFSRARGYLTDNDFRYLSPISEFDEAGAFIADISRIGAIMEKIERMRTFVDNNEVCVIANLKTSMSGLNTTPIVFWAKIVCGRIASLQTYFDARAYAAMFETD